MSHTVNNSNAIIMTERTNSFCDLSLVHNLIHNPVRFSSYITTHVTIHVTMEIIKTNKNGELLIHEGYGYIRHRALKDNITKSWKCMDKTCNGRLHTVGSEVVIITEHSHFPDPAEIEKRKFRSNLKQRAVIADEVPRQTILACQRQITREAAVAIPLYAANQRCVNRQRQARRPQMAEPFKLTGFTIPEALQKTYSGEQFLYHDSGSENPNRIIVFATLPALDLLAGCEEWFCDGTFSTAPDVFYQIYTIHGKIENSRLPLVYALLPDKKETTYDSLFACLPCPPAARVTIDFEIAVRNAVLKLNPDSNVRFCFFHLSQRVWTHVQSAGLKAEYSNNLEVREHIRMLVSLAFLPIEDIDKGFKKLQETCPEICQPIFNYFEDNYIGRLTSTGRQKPRFDPNMWSCRERVLLDKGRTNNAVEGWNGAFVKLVNCKHPSFPKLIEKFKDEQKNAEVLVEKMCAGQKVQADKKKKYAKIDQKLKEKVENYSSDDLIKYLRGCSYNIKL